MIWSVCCLFPAALVVVVLAVGLYAYMLVVPFAEAAEQTVLQKVVPYARQGRVFGFAQSVELSAAPLTAFVIGPLTQFVFIPFMTDGAGADADRRLVGEGRPGHRARLRARRACRPRHHAAGPGQPLYRR